MDPEMMAALTRLRQYEIKRENAAQAVIEAARAVLNPDMHPTSRAMVKAMQNLKAALEAHDEATIGEDE